MLILLHLLASPRIYATYTVLKKRLISWQSHTCTWNRIACMKKPSNDKEYQSQVIMSSGISHCIDATKSWCWKPFTSICLWISLLSTNLLMQAEGNKRIFLWTNAYEYAYCGICLDRHTFFPIITMMSFDFDWIWLDLNLEFVFTILNRQGFRAFEYACAWVCGMDGNIPI